MIKVDFQISLSFPGLIFQFRLALEIVLMLFLKKLAYCLMLLQRHLHHWKLIQFLHDQTLILILLPNWKPVANSFTCYNIR